MKRVIEIFNFVFLYDLFFTFLEKVSKNRYGSRIASLKRAFAMTLLIRGK
jgi:hypothetical protein